MAELIDSHVHLRSAEGATQLDSICRRIGAKRMGIVCLHYDPQSNSAAFQAKKALPDRFYVFAALDHSSRTSSMGSDLGALPLDEQVRVLIEKGADGIKLLETKPDSRKALGIPIDSDYFEPFFAYAEREGIPIVWHAADPPEFWVPRLTPKWAVEKGWGYDETFPSYEQILAEVENVLERHPGLVVTFAHFLFLSNDLPRAANLLDTYDNVHFDLAPGIELLYNLSRNPTESREFFVTYARRIIFGTDIEDSLSLEQAAHRAGIVKRFLETDDEFRVPEGADELLGPPEDGVIRGLRLPAEVLEMIYHRNFERIVGEHPRALSTAD
ncbi:MAG: amidohydrolase family protein [Armatimonadota bacterium]|nr:amidohydrolase family protein [Armatimonadota bacterium]